MDAKKVAIALMMFVGIALIGYGAYKLSTGTTAPAGTPPKK